ncbi:MAG TPA: hypothetical protein VMC09_05320 [Anaerolineales bacterium]|nr:hypothetical protein [Anaerolineales bacterium]
MNLTAFLNSSIVAWAMVGLLMLMVAMLAFLRNRQLVKERVAILVIAMVMLLALLALTLGEG